MRVALYLRVSSEEQAKGHSLDSQRDLLMKWALEEGWEISSTYEDPGLSATSATKRVAFQQMITDARERAFDRVLVKNRSRYARNIGDAAAYEQLLAASGVRVWSYDERSTNDDTPSAFLMRGMLDVWSAHYSIELSHKTRQGWKKRAEKGLAVGDVPFGYRRARADQPLSVDEDEAAAVRDAFRAYSSGDTSMVMIAEMLNDRGCHPRSKQGNVRFSKASVERMLANPLYCGDVTFHGEVVARDTHPPIVDRVLWERVRAARQARTDRPRSFGVHAHREYLLSGIGICATCGGRLWADSNAKGRASYYRCSTTRKGGGQCSVGSIGGKAELIERGVEELLMAVRLPDDWRELIREQLEDASWHDSDLELSLLRQKADRIRRMIRDGVEDYDRGLKEIRAIERRIEDVNGASAAPMELAAATLDDLPELWPHATQAERRRIVGLLTETVAVELTHATVRGIVPRAEYLPLFRTATANGRVQLCAWRPRSDSNRRSPP